MSDLSVWESQTGGTWNWTQELAERWIPNWAPQDETQFDEPMLTSGYTPPPTNTIPPSTSATPEPTAGLLFAAGMLVVVASRKRLG